MDLISDISSVSSHGSMPPLIDAFGRIILNDDDQDTIPMMEPESTSGWVYEAEYESTDYDEDEEEYEPPCEIPQNTHVYFGDSGEEISREQFLMKEAEQQVHNEVQEEEEEEKDDFGIKSPQISYRFTMRHPRVILNFLRFIDTHNEVAKADELYMIPAIPKKVYDNILRHVSFVDTPPEFEHEVNELKWRLERHLDLSELPVN